MNETVCQTCMAVGEHRAACKHDAPAAQRQCTAPTACRWPKCSCEPQKHAAGVAPTREALAELGAAYFGAQEASEHQAVRGVFAGESMVKAAEGWAAWCERRHLSSLSEFLIDVSRALGVALPLKDKP